ncbi:hypothetical protein [Vibrio navarrensis]|uniref:hypothetical protein n=1 Tax=Vibrio navarrensis TaxID=29495 RepID=UPI0018DD1207|nr:hypothetical protein [Vibrio navarrensis]MBH9741728.1 hypothetical protein [Vibrio navarrensis]
MKKILSFTLIAAIQGCANQPTVTSPVEEQPCIGSTTIDGELSSQFNPIQDTSLLSQAIGEPLQGKLCQGAVYESTQEVTIYRAWNSTNPNSQLGQWWSFQLPSGYTADYRKNFEICYQWSPLDKLAKCTLKAGAKVVVGNGQSAKCSEYLSYPVSAAQQVFISDAASSVQDCQIYDSVIAWE